MNKKKGDISALRCFYWGSSGSDWAQIAAFAGWPAASLLQICTASLWLELPRYLIVFQPLLELTGA